MNCKFCASEIPDGSEVCRICGKSLAEALPEPGEGGKKKRRHHRRHRKGLTLPFILLLIGALSWLAFFYYRVFEDIRTLWNAIFGGATSLASNSDFESVGSAQTNDLAIKGILEIGVIIVATLIGLFGLVMLFRHLYNRVKYRDEK